MTGVASHLAVGAIVRRASDILLVIEPDPDGGEPTWALPGGTVEGTRHVGRALCHRVAGDTGLVDVEPGPLLWVANYTVGGADYTTYGFAVEAAGAGDERVLWVPVAEAVERLGRMWFAPIREPAVAYLAGRAASATLWTWPRLDGPPVTVPPLRATEEPEAPLPA